MKKLSTLLLTAFALLFLTVQIQAQITVSINAPGGLAGEVTPVGNTNADFGGNFAIGESITADLAITLTANADSLGKWQGCDDLVNAGDVAGKIALVRRGTCPFSDKIWFAQAAGAVGVIICNNVPGDVVINMATGGTWPGQDTIPACMLSYDDCEEIFAAINAGETVNVTFKGPVPFYDAAMSYSYHTPLSQVIPMDVIRVNLINITGADVTNVTVTCDITDPDGVITSLETIFPFIANGADSLIFLPEFTPTKVGEYTGTFTNSLNAEVLTEKFVITDKLFATDRGTITTANNRQDLFEANQTYVYHYGNLYQTGVNPSIATHISFGIGNAQALFTGNPEFDVVNLVLYNGDVNSDGILDFSTSATFDDLTPIGLGTYSITGNEGAQEVLTAEVFSTSGAETIELNPLGIYYAVLKYDGDATSATICPSFIGSSHVNYGSFTTCMYLGSTFYNGGWADASVLSRLHIDETIDNTTNLTPLDNSSARIFPNPVNESVNLELDLKAVADEVRVDMINFDGKVVGSYQLQNVQKGLFDFSTGHLSSGIYFLSVKTPEGYRSIKFSVVR